MPTNHRISLLLVLDSSPESGASPALLNAFLSDFVKALSSVVELSLYYPIFSVTEESYSLSVIKEEDVTRYITFIPPRFRTMEETYRNKRLDDVFSYVLKEKSFDIIHIISLKNHSISYPQLAKERRIPVILTISDFFLRSPLIFSDTHPEQIKISNFVASPFRTLITKIERIFAKNDDVSYWWYEQIGRYSDFYNSSTATDKESLRNFLEKRNDAISDALLMTDIVHFFSETLYNARYRTLVPEERTIIIPQGINLSSISRGHPFEINGPISFGFIGNIIPEEGIVELMEAVTMLRKHGLFNRLHVYGDIFQNRDFFNQIKETAKASQVEFHGPIDPHRISAALDVFDVLVMPSRWQRSDTHLIYSAIARRKAIITAHRSAGGEIVRKTGRGITLDSPDAQSLFSAMTELETNRKKLYYHMRITNDFPFVTLEETVKQFVDRYGVLVDRYADKKSATQKKRLRKRIDRTWDGI